jgi:hypothetical protein
MTCVAPGDPGHRFKPGDPAAASSRIFPSAADCLRVGQDPALQADHQRHRVWRSACTDQSSVQGPTMELSLRFRPRPDGQQPGRPPSFGHARGGPRECAVRRPGSGPAPAGTRSPALGFRGYPRNLLGLGSRDRALPERGPGPHCPPSVRRRGRGLEPMSRVTRRERLPVPRQGPQARPRKPG